MKIPKIIKSIGTIIILIILIFVIAFFAYRIGKIDMHNEMVSCTNNCMNWAGNIKGDCFKACVWSKTHDYKIVKMP